MTENLLYVKVFNSIQYATEGVAIVAGLVFSFIVFIGLLYSKDNQNKYKDILLVLSFVHLVAVFLYAFLFPILTFPTGLIYLFAKNYPTWLVFILATIADLLASISAELLAISMVYKVIFLMKPKYASASRLLLYCITLPIPLIQNYYLNRFKVQVTYTCDFICPDWTVLSPSREYMRDVTEKATLSYGLNYFMYLIVVVAGVPSILILNRWFNRGGFSSRTLSLQRRLMKAWLAMILLQFFFYLPDNVYRLAPYLPASIATQATVVLTTISVIIVYWLIPLRCIIIFWTVRKLLRYPKWVMRLLDRFKVRQTSTTALAYITLISSWIATIVYSFPVVLGILLSQKKNKYVDIVLLMSLTNGLTVLLYVPTGAHITFPTGQGFFLGEYYPDWLLYIFVNLGNFMIKLAAEVVAAGMVYKGITLMRPQWETTLRCLLPVLLLPGPIYQTYIVRSTNLQLVPSCNLICLDANISWPMSLTTRDVAPRSPSYIILDNLTFLVAIVLGLPCMLLLRHWFKRGHFSQATRHLQSRLLRAWGAIILLQCIGFLPGFVYGQAMKLSGTPYRDQVCLFLTTICLCMIYWIFPIRSIIIYYSVRSMLKFPSFNWTSPTSR